MHVSSPAESRGCRRTMPDCGRVVLDRGRADCGQLGSSSARLLLLDCGRSVVEQLDFRQAVQNVSPRVHVASPNPTQCTMPHHRPL